MSGYFRRFIQESKRSIPTNTGQSEPHQVNSIFSHESDKGHVEERLLREQKTNKDSYEKQPYAQIDNLTNKSESVDRTNHSLQKEFQQQENKVTFSQQQKKAVRPTINIKNVTDKTINTTVDNVGQPKNLVNQNTHNQSVYKSPATKKTVIKRKVSSEKDLNSQEIPTQRQLTARRLTEVESVSNRADKKINTAEWRSDIKEREKQVSAPGIEKRKQFANNEEKNDKQSYQKLVNDDSEQSHSPEQTDFEKNIENFKFSQGQPKPEQYQPVSRAQISQEKLKLSPSISVHIGAVEIQVVEPEKVQPQQNTRTSELDADSRLLLRRL